MLRHGMERNLFAVFSLNATWFQFHGVTELIAALVLYLRHLAQEIKNQCKMKMSETNVHVLL